MKALISLSSLVFGLSLGSLALPKEIARVGFYSVDRHGASLVIPGETGATIRASQIGKVLGRVMLSDLTPQTDIAGKTLPSGMVLNPPDLGILIFVDGIPPDGNPSMSFLQNLLQSSSSLGIVGDVDDGGVSNTDVLASAMDHHFPLSPMSCLELERNVKGSFKALGSTSACSTITSFYTGNEEPREALKQLGMDPKSIPSGLNISPISDNLHLLASLCDAVGFDKLCSMTSRNKQESLVLHLSLTSLSESPERSKLESVMDEAITVAVMRLSVGMNCIFRPRLVVQFVAGLDLAPPRTETGSFVNVEKRSLQMPSRVAAAELNSGVDVELVDIVQYQLNLWTGVCLVVAVMAAIGIIAFMDFGHDSLLYAKFPMNTQGFKND